MNERITVWTLQPLKVYERLQSQNQLTVDIDCALKEGSMDFLQDAYDWMREQMTLRVPSYQGRYPWWGWHKWFESRPRPDLRSERHRCVGPHVRLELSLPREEVVLSDYDGWHAVLNNWYLAENDADSDAFDAEVEAWRNPEGLTLKEWVRRWKAGGEPPLLLPNAIDSKRRESWVKCLDIEGMAKNEYFNPDGRANQAVQACFEVLRLSDVVKVTPFQGIYKPKGGKVAACE